MTWGRFNFDKGYWMMLSVVFVNAYKPIPNMCRPYCNLALALQKQKKYE
jgi:hypothetical protein